MAVVVAADRRSGVVFALALVLITLGGAAGKASDKTAADRSTPCPRGVGYEVGAAKADITPRKWPVAEAAYGIGRLAGGAAHPFYARAVAIKSCGDAATIVIVALDSQGYFTAYKEDPLAAFTDPSQGYGTTAIRLSAQALTGVPADNMVISATHTHNSPDSVGIWGGGGVANNKAAYLSVVKSQTVDAIREAVTALRPARLSAGSADISAFLGTYGQVSRDPAHFPTDHTLRILQAVTAEGCRPIATLINAGIHADIAGPLHGKNGLDLIDPDWPGRVAADTEAQLTGETAVVMPGAVGRTGPSFPLGTDPHSKSDLVQVAAYGDALFRRVATALTQAVPLPNGVVRTLDTRLHEEIAEPALIPLFFDEQGIPGAPGSGPTLGGTMRSVLPPYTVGTTLSAEIQTFRIGPLMLVGAPGEAYPEVASELAQRVNTGKIPTFTFGLANDQLGYTPPTFEFPVVALSDGGDEGFFTINAHFGNDIINRHLAAARTLGFTTTGQEPYLGLGPVVPPDQQKPAPDHPIREPRESPLRLHC